jgi:hypothetical protein
LLSEYIEEQIVALKELFLYQYLSNDEKKELRQAPNEAKANLLMHTFRDKYYDLMLSEYEDAADNDYLDLPLEQLELKTKTFYSLMRKKLITSGQFIEFVEENGWKIIPGFGVTACKDIYSQIYLDIDEQEIDRLVKKTKNPPKEY